MRHFCQLIIGLLLLNNEVFSALLNEACQSADDCETANSICAPLAAMCLPFGSFCHCREGFTEDRGRCKRVGYYDDGCDENGICDITNNSHLACNVATATCECDIGYQPNYKSDPIKCIGSSPQKGRVGEHCTTDPVDTCGQNLECLDGVCTCMTGYKYSVVEDKCKPIGLGDSCIGDQDCYHVIRSVCNRVCLCPPNFQVHTITYKTETVHACLQLNNSPRSLGDNCTETGSKHRSYCADPFICTKCTPDNSVSICTLPPGIVLTTTSGPSSTLETITTTTTTATTPTEKIDNVTTTNYVPTDTTMAVSGETSYVTEEKTSETTTSVVAMSTKHTATKVPVIITVIPNSGLLGGSCNDDSNCGILFSTCDNGICRCQDGYINRTATECIEYFAKIPLGQPCQGELDSDFCATKYSTCINGTCQCDTGYKTGPKGVDCIDLSRVRIFGEKCTSTKQCYYNLVCFRYKCQCSPGYKESNPFFCSKRELGDNCPSGLNIDCRFISKGVCSSDRRCKCAVGYIRQSATSCVPLVITQTEVNRHALAVSCTGDEDCWTDATAPKMSVCLESTMLCGCPQNNSVYNETTNRCQYFAPTSDIGFACIYDTDCPFRTKCVQNTCGGKPTSSLIIISVASNAKPTSAVVYLRSFLVLFFLLIYNNNRG